MWHENVSEAQLVREAEEYEEEWQQENRDVEGKPRSIPVPSP